MSVNESNQSKARKPELQPIRKREFIGMTSSQSQSCASFTLHTASNFDSESLHLLELNEDIVRAITSEKSIYIIGDADQRAVLCTSTHSYFIMKEDTSNNKYLTMHACWDRKDIVDTSLTESIILQGSTTSHFILQSKPFDHVLLKMLLMENPYNPNRQDTEATQGQSYTMTELCNRLQSSSSQVTDHLQEMHAFHENGYWRILDPEYQEQVFDAVLCAVSDNDWDMFSNGCSIEQLQSQVHEPVQVLRTCVHIYGSKNPDTQKFFLDKQKVAIFCAKQLFHDISSEEMLSSRNLTQFAFPNVTLEQFMRKWQLRTPEQITVDINFLRGFAVISTINPETRIVYFPQDTLPMNVTDRFEALFNLQETWTLSALEPYLEALVRSEGQTKEDLLLEFTRTISDATLSEKLYAKR